MIFVELFFTFFKIGLFTFGGGYAMLPLIQSEVLAKGWVTNEALVNFIAVSESTPGPFAINIATYIGTVKAGVPGAACATLGVVMPSFLIILLIASLFKKTKDSFFLKGILEGLKPAVIGLIGAAVLSVGKTVFFPDGVSAAVLTSVPFYASLAIFACAGFLLIKKAHPILIIFISACLGIAAGYLIPGL